MKTGNNKGFTMIELLMIVAIIGVLAAMAVAQFSNYRTRSYNSSAQSDLRTVATVQEAYFIDNSSYTSTLGNLTATSYGIGLSDGVILPILSADSTGYTMQAHHGSGNLTYTLAGPGGVIDY